MAAHAQLFFQMRTSANVNAEEREAAAAATKSAEMSREAGRKRKVCLKTRRSVPRERLLMRFSSNEGQKHGARCDSNSNQGGSGGCCCCWWWCWRGYFFKNTINLPSPPHLEGKGDDTLTLAKQHRVPRDMEVGG